MKTITKNGVIARVDNAEADQKVRVGWKFCPKSEWKFKVRDVGKKKDENAD